MAEPMAITMADPITNPATVPAIAFRAVAPVDAAFVRSTDSVPSTTQKPCWTLVRSATATAAAMASAPRTLLIHHTERRLACRAASPPALMTRPDRGFLGRRRGHLIPPPAGCRDGGVVGPAAGDEGVGGRGSGRHGEIPDVERQMGGGSIAVGEDDSGAGPGRTGQKVLDTVEVRLGLPAAHQRGDIPQQEA